MVENIDILPTALVVVTNTTEELAVNTELSLVILEDAARPTALKMEGKMRCRQLIIKIIYKVSKLLILHALLAVTFNKLNVTTQCSSLCLLTFTINTNYLLE